MRSLVRGPLSDNAAYPNPQARAEAPSCVCRLCSKAPEDRQFLEWRKEEHSKKEKLPCPDIQELRAQTAAALEELKHFRSQEAVFGRHLNIQQNQIRLFLSQIFQGPRTGIEICDYILKPFSSDDLLKRIRMVFDPESRTDTRP